MATIRSLSERDIPAVAALFGRVYPGHRWGSQAACASYFREMLFHNPWRNLDLPSWVAEEDGRISACYAVVPRPMLFRGSRIRVAIGCQFMVDPDRRSSLTALQLAKACLSGPQDLTIADGATEQVRHGWLGIGGTAPPLYGLHWTRPLRPARFCLSVMEERSVLPRLVAQMARPLCSLTDVLAARLRPNRFLHEETGLSVDTLDAATMLAHLPEMLYDCVLQPVYQPRTLAWLLEQAARKTHQGKLRAFAVRDRKQKLIGWYLYYLLAGGISEIVQVAATYGSFDRVMKLCLADAWQHGAVAARGRLDPRYLQELSNQHCWLRADGTWTLVHSRHSEIIDTIQHGEAFLSRLEGEWWMHFMGEERTSQEVFPSLAGVGASPPSRAWTQG